MASGNRDPLVRRAARPARLGVSAKELHDDWVPPETPAVIRRINPDFAPPEMHNGQFVFALAGNFRMRADRAQPGQPHGDGLNKFLAERLQAGMTRHELVAVIDWFFDRRVYKVDSYPLWIHLRWNTMAIFGDLVLDARLRS